MERIFKNIILRKFRSHMFNLRRLLRLHLVCTDTTVLKLKNSVKKNICHLKGSNLPPSVLEMKDATIGLAIHM